MNTTLPKTITQNKNLIPASQLKTHPPQTTQNQWNLNTLQGRLIEISGNINTATLSLCAPLILQAQQKAEPTAWITDPTATFYPPDLQAAGIDLKALPVIQITQPKHAPQIADTLLRSGGFALIIIDLPHITLPRTTQARLAALTQKHQATLIIITQKPPQQPSLGAAISLHAHTTKKRTHFNTFSCELHITKDKHNAPGWRHKEVHHGPDGLC